VETVWKRKDDGRRLVRLVALAVPPDSVEIVVEDITELRRGRAIPSGPLMEAVGGLRQKLP
jgi:hypothetical protein